MLKYVLAAALLGGCGDSGVDEADNEGTSSQASTGSGSGSGLQERADPCVETPIDSKGTLPACVAGRSTTKGPGRAKGAVLEDVPVPEAAVLSAADAANRLSVARTASDPADRGFAPLPSVKEAGQ
ncbi:MAG: hypothetical protein ACKV2T_16715 [Kofleriaceae bacterium]